MLSIAGTGGRLMVSTRTMKLSEVQQLLKERKPIDGRGRMIQSIQESLRVEGYDVATDRRQCGQECVPSAWLGLAR